MEKYYGHTTETSVTWHEVDQSENICQWIQLMAVNYRSWHTEVQLTGRTPPNRNQILTTGNHTITSYVASYVPTYVPPGVTPLDPSDHPSDFRNLHIHVRKSGRKITNWPVDPALAFYRGAENSEPCLRIGGKRPPKGTTTSPPPRPASVRDPSVRSPSVRAHSVRAPSVRAPSPPPPPNKVKAKKPKKGHPLIVKVRPPKISSRSPSEAGSDLSELSQLRPVSKLPLWVRAQKKKQADAAKQTQCWEKQLVGARRHPSGQVHEKGSRTTL
ncbi:hypothetical protein CONLIGDRAFT_640739 [Coniochaeta ligniaria NRRL 30616]|uniref:Uncharacterized protein n=1 Tax=Coniochaeta ligniaria NRRL 30616 TaxID=1408157 RepID=A0A1J7JW54_9PEZI|nr:hypothetical protein CONLIGDRAFT_640739 [Coniochaeta ligniaria NRRL 30616]